MKQASKRASTGRHNVLGLVLIEFFTQNFFYFYSAEPSRFKEPKLIYDESAVPSIYDDSWDTPADQPSFRPEDLRAQSSQMM